MRAVPEALAEKLASGAATLAHLWRVTRRDGQVFGFTDHDGDLVAGGVAYEAQAGFQAGAIEKHLGLAIDTANAEGALSSEAISAADLAAGLWDGAHVDIWLADWTAPESRTHLFAGRLGEVRRGEAAFAAELRGLQAALNAPVGRVYARFCDAELGDARCGVNLLAPAFHGEGVVIGIVSAAAFKASGLSGFGEGFFTRGVLTWSSGAQADVVAHREGAEATIELATPLLEAIEIGASFTVTAGCDKTLAMCGGRFANVLNHRGFPHMPGNDIVQSGPTAAEPLDGGSRWR